jgi:hypothetical protein
MNMSNYLLMKIMIFLVLFVTVKPAADDELAAIEESQIVAERVSIYEKYNNLLPYSISFLRTVRTSSPNMQRYVMDVIEYANDLETKLSENVDILTIKDEKYWKAVFILGIENSALYPRLYLLLREGFLERAEMLLLFFKYGQRNDFEIDKTTLKAALAEIKEIRESSNGLIREGIKYWDKGEKHAAILTYYKALGLYPKNPWALYEISLSHCTINKDGQMIWNEEVERYYRLIRFLDPLYKFAYQGKLTPELLTAKQALEAKVAPSCEKLWKGENVLINMRELADGCFEMQEYEFALYAYRFLLFHTYDGKFNQSLVARISDCLIKLEMNCVVDFLNELLGTPELIMGPD